MSGFRDNRTVQQAGSFELVPSAALSASFKWTYTYCPGCRTRTPRAPAVGRNGRMPKCERRGTTVQRETQEG